MKKKQAIAFLLSTAMTTGTVIPAFGAASDINGHWAETTIAKWQNDGRIGGYEDGTFKPDKTITRAEFVRLLNTTATTAFTSSANINFSDVKESDWFFGDVSKAVGSKIASGFEDETFRPWETVTRAQAAVFICNAKGLAGNEAAANFFADAADIPVWAKGAVGAAVSAGYLSGYPDGTFGANKGMTRAEAVSTLDRLSGITSTPADPNQGVSTPSDSKEEKEDNAQSGEMVWTGDGSTTSKKSSGGGGSSSSSSSSKYKNVKIASQEDADKYANKTLTGTTEIYLSENMTFNNVSFEDVEVYAQDTVKAAYIGDDAENTAVAPAISGIEVVIYFNGSTAVSGNLNINKNDVADKVVIQVNTTNSVKRVARELFAKVATVIRGPVIVPNVTAEAPVSIEEGASVSTVEAKDNASIVVDESSNVDTINATGDVKEIVLEGNTGNPAQVNVSGNAKVESIEVAKDAAADVSVRGNAEVKNVTASDKAAANVAVSDSAKVEKVEATGNASTEVKAKGSNAKVENVELSGNATGKVEVTGGATVDKVTSTSTGETEIKGDSNSTVGKIEATDESTIKKDETIDTEVETVTTVSSVSISGASEVEVGKTITLTASVLPSDAINSTVTWTSSDDSVATVSSTGVVTGVKSGTVTITAKAGDKTATKTITVKTTSTSDDKPSGGDDTTGLTITGTPEENKLILGSDTKNTATLKVMNGSTEVTEGITWESSNTAIATVADGVVTAVAAGTTTITAKTEDGKTATITITVEAKTATNMELSETTINLAKKADDEITYDLSTITANVTYNDGSTNEGTITWSLSDPTNLPTGVTFTEGKTITVSSTLAADATLKFVATLEGTELTKELKVDISSTAATYDGVSIETETAKITDVEPTGTVALKAYKIASKDVSMKEELSVADVTYNVTVKDMSSGTATTDLSSLKDNFCFIADGTLTVKTDGFTNAIKKVQITVTATADVSGSKTSKNSVVITARSTSVPTTLTLTAPADNAEIEQGAGGTLTGTLNSQYDEAIGGTIDWTVSPENAVTFTGDNSTTVGANGEVSQAFTVADVATAGDVTITAKVGETTVGTKIITVKPKTTITKPTALIINTSAGGSYTFTFTAENAATKKATYTIISSVPGDNYRVYDMPAVGELLSDPKATADETTLTLTFTTMPDKETTYYIATVRGDMESECSQGITVVPYKDPIQPTVPNADLNMTIAEGTSVGDIKITSTDATEGVSYKYAFGAEEITDLKANAEVPTSAEVLANKTAGANVSLSTSDDKKIGNWVTLYAYKTENNKEVVVSYKSVQITNDVVNAPTAATATMDATGKVTAYTAPSEGISVYALAVNDIPETNGAIDTSKLTEDNKLTENKTLTLTAGTTYKLVTVHDNSGTYAVASDEIQATAGDEG